jgi:hypothetical protein
MNQNGKYGKKWCVCGSVTEKSVIYRFFGKESRALSAKNPTLAALGKRIETG